NANGRAMTRPKVLRKSGVKSKRQKTGSGGDAMPLDHHGPIMQRRGRIENVYQQIVAQFSVKLHTTIGDILQSHIAFDHYQRACFQRCQRCGCEHYFVVNTLAKLAVMTPRQRQTETIAERDECLTDLCLE